MDTIHRDTQELISWVQETVLSPDHPYGHEMMDKAQQHFDSSSNISLDILLTSRLHAD